MDGYCCPELKWVGLHTADVQLLETPTAETPGRSVLAATSFQPYSDRDGAIVDGLLRNPVRRALCYPWMPTACHPFRDCGQILVFPTRGVWGSEAEGLRGRPFSFTHCGANKACSVAVPGWASPGSLSVNGHVRAPIRRWWPTTSSCDTKRRRCERIDGSSSSRCPLERRRTAATSMRPQIIVSDVYRRAPGVARARPGVLCLFPPRQNHLLLRCPAT